MHLNFLDVLSNLVGLFLLIGVGYFSAKAGILPERSSELCTRLLMKITLPCTVFVSLLNDYDPAFLGTTLKLIGLGFILFPLNSLLAKPLAHVFRVESEHRGVRRLPSLAFRLMFWFIQAGRKPSAAIHR